MQRLRLVVTVLCVTALTLAVFNSPRPVAADSAYGVRNGWASAYQTLGSSGCLHTTLYVNTGEWASRSVPGQRYSGGYVSFGIWTYDACNSYYSFYTLYGWADLAGPELKIGPLKAQLNVSLQAYDYNSWSYRPVTINLKWTCTEKPYRSSYDYTYETPEYTLQYRYMGVNCSARATGVILVDGVPVVNGTLPGYMGNYGYGNLILDH